MTHPLVQQLRFTRSEWIRGLKDVSAEEAVRRFEPMNCISWLIGHLANQEQFYWVLVFQGSSIARDLHKIVGIGQPATTPPLDEMWNIWHEVTAAADTFLDTLTNDQLNTVLEFRGKPLQEPIGTLLLRNIFHYWYHLGEAQAIRQLLGHTDLPQFIGDLSSVAFDVE